MKEKLHRFLEIDVKDEVPDNHHGLVLAFVPFIGFISAKYYTGSKTWKSNETQSRVTVTHWLKKV